MAPALEELKVQWGYKAIMTRTKKYRAREPGLVWVVREGFLEEEISNLRSHELVGFNQAEVKRRRTGWERVLRRKSMCRSLGEKKAWAFKE